MVAAATLGNQLLQAIVDLVKPVSDAVAGHSTKLTDHDARLVKLETALPTGITLEQAQAAATAIVKAELTSIQNFLLKEAG